MLGKRNKSTERERERESKGTRAREKSTKYTAVGSGQKKGVSKVCFFFLLLQYLHVSAKAIWNSRRMEKGMGS